MKQEAKLSCYRVKQEPTPDDNTNKMVKTGNVYQIYGFVFDQPVTKQGEVLMFTKFELGVNDKLVNTLYSPTQHTPESLHVVCGEMLDVKSLFE